VWGEINGGDPKSPDKKYSCLEISEILLKHFWYVFLIHIEAINPFLIQKLYFLETN